MNMDSIYAFLLVAVLPVALIAVFVVTVIVVLIVVLGKVIRSRTSAVSTRTFEKLAMELKEENAKITAELSTMKESLGSIEQMMREVG